MVVNTFRYIQFYYGRRLNKYFAAAVEHKVIVGGDESKCNRKR